MAQLEVLPKSAKARTRCPQRLTRSTRLSGLSFKACREGGAHVLPMGRPPAESSLVGKHSCQGGPGTAPTWIAGHAKGALDHELQLCLSSLNSSMSSKLPLLQFIESALAAMQVHVGTSDDFGINVRYAVGLLVALPAIPSHLHHLSEQKRARHPEPATAVTAMLPHSHASFQHFSLPPCGHFVVSSNSLSESTGVPAAHASHSRSCIRLHVGVCCQCVGHCRAAHTQTCF